MSRKRLLALPFLLLCFACTDPPPQGPPAGSPEAAVLDLFRFASTMTAGTVLPGDLVEPGLLEDHGAELLDRLEPLRGTGRPRILSVERFPETGRVAVDLELDLAGEGLALWSAQLEEHEGGGWRLVWLQGPDGGWPPKEAGRGEGLTTSPVE